MPEPIDMLLPLLPEMRAEMTSGFSPVETRLEKLEAQMTSFRHALTADSLLSKLVTGEFEQRIELLERKVKELEGLK